jgi:hypothetical protein
VLRAREEVAKPQEGKSVTGPEHERAARRPTWLKSETQEEKRER